MKPEAAARWHCRVCGRLTQSTVGKSRELCGPHALPIPKPVDWWDGFEDEMRELV